MIKSGEQTLNTSNRLMKIEMKTIPAVIGDFASKSLRLIFFYFQCTICATSSNLICWLKIVPLDASC